MSLENKLPSNKKFGIFLICIFLLVLFFLNNNLSNLLIYFFIFLIISLSIILVTKESLLLPLNKLWMTIGIILGKLISPIIIGAIFFLILSPLAILFKIIGRDELNLKKNKFQTNWKLTKDTKNYKKFFRNQF